MRTSGDFDCSTFDELESNNVVRGEYTCRGSETTPGSIGTGTSSGSSASGTSSAGQFQANLPAVLGGTSVMAGLLQLIL